MQILLSDSYDSHCSFMLCMPTYLCALRCSELMVWVLSILLMVYLYIFVITVMLRSCEVKIDVDVTDGK